MSDVLLAQKWENEDPTGWWISEKLDGVRALWRGGEFSSRGDNKFACPDWFKKKMPSGCILDGEIWGGRGQFQKTVGIVKSSSRGNEWDFMTFMIFDCLDEGGRNIEGQPFEQRLEAVKRITSGSTVAKCVPMERCRGKEHLTEALAQVEERGGEGLMLRCPGSKYEHRRSKSLLKVKTFHDEEAIVVGHDGGSGRLEGMCGALLCETPDKRRFKVGSGLSDAQRRDPPRVNSVITYRYQELTNANIPRFPTLAGERADLTWAQICAKYVPPGPKKDAALKKKHSILFDEASAPSSSSASAAISSPVPQAEGAPKRSLKRQLSDMDARQLGTAEQDLDDFGFEDMMPPIACHPTKKPHSEAASKESDGLPVCVYGQKCYRKNPAHFMEFAHPWTDKENEAATSTASKAAERPSFAEDAAAIFDAETLPGPLDIEAAPALPPVPPPAIPEPAVALFQKASSATSVPVASVPELDVRMLEVRNLLASMLKDAKQPAARTHLDKLLKLSGEPVEICKVAELAAGSHEAPGAPEAPRAVQPAVISSGHSPPRSLASALLSAEPGAEATTAGTDLPPVLDPKAKLAQELSKMGFPDDGIHEALKHCSTADESVDWLLARSM
mmetsp:Transcript_106897/g.189990  ORF Transcript_106897/g.189990 Transcript_106897/m.189990 type:complete len:616 (-) Transcript_106897:155-2002(-)